MQPPYQQPTYQPYQQFSYQPQPKKRTYKSNILHMLIVTGMLILGLFVSVVISGGGISSLQRIFTTTCSVGMVGAHAAITFTGVDAETQCNQIVTYPGNKVKWYELQGAEPTGNVMCEGTIQGDTIIVRDQGVFNFYGSEICSNFLKAGMTPTS